MNAEIITIGTEILLGQIDDTNATFISRELAGRGINVLYRASVGDNTERIVEAFQRAAERSDLVLVTGGLGPTFDDITLECAAAAFDVPLVEDPDVRTHIEGFYAALGFDMNPISLRQARIPKGARAFLNPVGSAPGVLYTVETGSGLAGSSLAGSGGSGGVLFGFFPGVPRELKRLLPTLLDEVERLRPDPQAIVSRTLRLFGAGESQLESRLPAEIATSKNPSLAFLAGRYEVTLRVTARGADRAEAEALAEPMVGRLYELFADYIYGEGEARLEAVTLDLLKAKGLTLAVAESCTGGLIGSLLTAVPGASEAYLGGVISYASKVKVSLLGVSESLIEGEGVVSEAVAQAMARGVVEATGSDVGLAVTGDAGPTTGEAQGKVGAVCVGLHWPAALSDTFAWSKRFPGGRVRARAIMANYALDLLRRKLLADGAGSDADRSI